MFGFAWFVDGFFATDCCCQESDDGENQEPTLHEREFIVGYGINTTAKIDAKQFNWTAETQRPLRWTQRRKLATDENQMNEDEIRKA
jgi:hypothetical protein